MCDYCGCGLPTESPATVSGADSHHGHDHGHDHHEHAEDHSHTQVAQERQTMELRHAILEKNDRLAERNRGFFHARGVLVLNILSSPGSGKTTLIGETIRRLGKRLKTAVVAGDLATDNDARRLRDSGAPVVQVNTGTVCHLDAEMLARALKQVPTTELDLLIIENVGNLVCPASYDLGEDLRVVLLSVTEGEDKPLKYPPIFHAANAVIVSKIDLDKACDFNRETATTNIRHIAHHARMFEVSAKTGAGLDEWCDFLIQQHEAAKKRGPLTP
jgi:hydrogenase nickel incorporation protein HypB